MNKAKPGLLPNIHEFIRKHQLESLKDVTLFIVHLTNLFRIIGLSVVLVNNPDYWGFSHDYIFRPFFYVVIFFLWVWWVDKISKHTNSENEEAL